MQGAELKAIRETLGWGQRKFAEEIGMTQTYISQMESGAKPIERRTALAAAALLDPPVRVAIGRSQDSYHLLITKSGPKGVHRAHYIGDERYSDLDAAIDAAEKYAEEHDVPYIPSGHDHSRLTERRISERR